LHFPFACIERTFTHRQQHFGELLVFRKPWIELYHPNLADDSRLKDASSLERQNRPLHLYRTFVQKTS